MSDEPAFLRAILDDPSFATPRLVYADWLDDQSDPLSARKAAYIRLEARLAETPERSLNRIRFVRHLQQLAADLDPEWLAVVAHPALEACRVQFGFQCPARWDRLTPTADPRVRHCGSCDRAVHYCATLDEARRHATAGECVAVSPALVRRPGDLWPPRRGLPIAGGLRLTPETLDHLDRMSARAGQLDTIQPPAPSGPGIRPATEDEPDEQRPRRRKPTRRDKRIRPGEIDE